MLMIVDELGGAGRVVAYNAGMRLRGWMIWPGAIAVLLLAGIGFINFQRGGSHEELKRSIAKVLAAGIRDRTPITGIKAEEIEITDLKVERFLDSYVVNAKVRIRRTAFSPMPEPGPGGKLQTSGVAVFEMGGWATRFEPPVINTLPMLRRPQWVAHSASLSMMPGVERSPDWMPANLLVDPNLENSIFDVWLTEEGLEGPNKAGRRRLSVMTARAYRRAGDFAAAEAAIKTAALRGESDQVWAGWANKERELIAARSRE